MPPITSAPQNTRTTLITWLVVFVILFVVAAVFAIYYDVQWNKSAQTVDNLNSKYRSIISETDLASQDVTTLTTPKPGQPNIPAFTALVNQRNTMERLLSGSDKASFDDVAKNSKDTLVAIGQQLKAKGVSVTLPNNMLAAIRMMGDQVASSADAAAKAQADAKSAHDDAMKVTQERDRLLADKDKQIAAVSDQMKALQGQLEEYQKTKNANVEEMLASAKVNNDTANKRADALQNSLSQSQQQLASLQKSLSDLQTKLDRLRLNPNESLQRPDGRITKVVPESHVVYINIGQLNSVTPGLTFEVYDQGRGLPKLQNPNNQPEDNSDLPKGKASIEVIRVLPGASECRVVRTDPGQIISQGDLIENLVYDPNTKYNFYVFGSFDVSQAGTASQADAELMRRLVTQWGGKLQNGINVDTDFVVMGKEPVVPTLTDEDKTNPLMMQRYEEAVRNRDSYQETLNRAMQLHVPILNQNRFLYFTGYYDQATR
jgi:predicted  nucleic acid-binding Zn-ribbon protein